VDQCRAKGSIAKAVRLAVLDTTTMPRSRVLLVAATTGYQIRAFDQAASRLGVDLLIASDRCHVLEDPWGDRALPVRFDDPERAASVIAAGRFDGIIAVGDRPAIVAAAAARALGIPYNSPESVIACHDKFTARRQFEAAGLPVPEYSRIPLAEDPSRAAREAYYPCVLKPLGLSASRGVIRANNPEEFLAAFRRIRALMESPEILVTHEDHNRYLQVERFIEGREYALEGLVTRGHLQVLAVFDKPDPLDGPYFEETIYVTPSREPERVQSAIVEATRSAISALGLTHGPVHAEMRVNSAGVWMLEVAARPIGGLCSRALHFRGGEGLEDLVLRHALGEDVSAEQREVRASGVMMIPIPRGGIYEDVRGTEAARSVPGIDGVVITAKQGQKLVPLPEGSSYLGFLFARAESPDEVERALRESHRQLAFEISATLPVLRPA
jgi:biotin carboxylase